MQKTGLAKIAALSAMGLIPASLLVSAGLIQGFLGFRGMNDVLDAFMLKYQARFLVHPLFLLGGLGLAVGLNALLIVHLSFRRQEHAFSATLTLARGRTLNVAIVALGIFLLSALLAYSIAENFRILPRS